MKKLIARVLTKKNYNVIIFVFCLVLTTFSQQNSQNTQASADKNLKTSARVNPSTLAMEFSLPLMNYPGRGNNSTPVTLEYSSKVWGIETFGSWLQTINTHSFSVSDTKPKFAEGSSAGWKSSLIPPKLIIKDEFYNEIGDSWKFEDALLYHSSLYNSFQDDQNQGNLLPMGCFYYGTPETRCWYFDGHEICIITRNYYCINRESGHTTWEAPNPTGGTGLPTVREIKYVKRVHIQMPDGSMHEFRQNDSLTNYCTTASGSNYCNGSPQPTDYTGNYVSVDGSKMKLTVGNISEAQDSILTLSDGTKYLFPFNRMIGEEWFASEFVDSDGNKTTFGQTISTDGKLTGNITDTLARPSINDPFQQNKDAILEVGDQTYSLPGLSGNPLNYTLQWRKLEDVRENASLQPISYLGSDVCFIGGANTNATHDDNLDNPSTPDDDDGSILFDSPESRIRVCSTLGGVGSRFFNPVVLAAIKLPNEQIYRFKYNQYGEITQLIYPTGAYEKFEYEQIVPIGIKPSLTYDQANRGVKKRWVFNFTGIQEQYWEYEANVNNNQYPISNNDPYTIKTTAPDGTKTVKYLERTKENHFGFTNPSSGLPYEERVIDSNNVIRSRKLIKWIYTPNQNGSEFALRDTRPSKEISILIEGGQALATLREIEYDEPDSSNQTPNDPEYFARLNVKKVKIYHYAVIPLNVAQNGTIDDVAAYFNNNLLSNTAETDYLYEENYKARGISSLPKENLVYDKNGNVITKSQTKYDEQSYIELNGSGILTSSLTNTWINPNTYLRGKPTTSKVWDDDNDRWISTHTSYDQYGNPRKVWEAVADLNTPTRYVETEYSPDYGLAYPTYIKTPAPGDGVYGTDQPSEAWTTFDYTTGFPLTATNEFGQTTATEYDDPLLRPTKTQGINGFVIPITETIYDDNALTVKVRKQIDEQNWDEKTTFSDSLGRTVKTQAKDSQGDVFVETKYDLLGRPIAVTNPYRQGDTVYWSKTRYDEMGRAVEAYAPATWHPTNTGDSLGITEYGISSQTGFVGTVVTKTDASGRKSRTFTNALGQLTRVDEPGSNNQLDLVPQTTPTPNPSPTPPPNYPIDPPSCAINCPNNLTGSEYPMHSTYYEYNVQGKMVKVTQGVQKRFFMYDSLGRLIRVKQPEQEVNDALDKSDPATGNGKWTAKFTYDLFGNILTSTDAKGVTISYEYDKDNRVIKRSYAGEPEDQRTPKALYYYDGYGLENTPPLINNFAKGKLTKVINNLSENRYTHFDYLGRLVEYQQIIDGVIYSSYYKYNLSGKLIEEKYPSGRIVKNGLETDGDLASVVSKKETQIGYKIYASNFLYNSSGNILQVQLGNGLWETYVYNNRLQIKEMALGISNSVPNLWKISYEFGELSNSNTTVDYTKNSGNIAKQIIYSGNQSPLLQTFRYDSLNRIVEAKETDANLQKSWKQNWSYDRYGNRIGFSQFIGETQIPLNIYNLPIINEETNRFSENQGYDYDKNGNLTLSPMNTGLKFSFNGDNRQSDVRLASNSNNSTNLVGKYIYDGEGRRIKLITNTETTIFIYSNNKLIAEYSTKNPINSTTSYLTHDNLNSPRVVTDKLGNVKSRRDFAPFGEELYSNIGGRTGDNGQNFFSNNDNIRQKFTTYLRDGETNLDYSEGRMYQNSYGRFNSVDPEHAGAEENNPQTWNAYSYVNNNPIKYVDPTGLKYIICNSWNDCYYASDKEFAKAKRTGEFQFTGSGEFYERGSIFDNEGNFRGTYAQISIDDASKEQLYKLHKGAKPTLDVWEPAIRFYGTYILPLFALPGGGGTRGGLTSAIESANVATNLAKAEKILKPLNEVLFSNAKGEIGEAIARNILSKQGFEILATKAYVKIPGFARGRYCDFVVQHPITKEVIAIEVKTGASRGSQQLAKDLALSKVGGVVGKSGDKIAGQVLGPTRTIELSIPLF